MSANIEQIKAMLEHTVKTNLLQNQKVDLDKERLQLEANVNTDKIDESLEEAANKFGFKETHERLREGEITRKNEGMFRWQIEKAFKAGVKWMVGQFQKIEGELVDWYSTSDGKDYCCGVKSHDSFEVPEGFYIRKK